MTNFENPPANDPDEALRAAGMTQGEDGVWRSPEGDVYDPSKISHVDVPAAPGDTEPASTFDAAKFAARIENAEPVDTDNADTFINEEVPDVQDGTQEHDGQ